MGDYYIELLFKALAYTYIVWGFTFSIHLLLVMARVESAIKWAKKWYSPKGLYYEIVIFFPMIYICYILLEIIPSLLGIEKNPMRFNLDNIVSIVFDKES